jgi:hypothetical protein
MDGEVGVDPNRKANPMALKYLFTAIYNDGTSLLQTQDDVSSTGEGSAFTDVQHDKLVEFRLFDVESGCEYGVDLTDGTFFTKTSDGTVIPFRMTEVPAKDLRLIFFRRHTHHFMMNASEEPGEETGHTIVYRLGWQGNDHEGKNVQHVIEFD